MHLGVVAPRCWPDPASCSELQWHLARSLQEHNVRLSVWGWKRWPAEPDQTRLEAARFLRLQRPGGLFSSTRAGRELAQSFRTLLPELDALLLLDWQGEFQPCVDLARARNIPVALWLERLPRGQAGRGPHWWSSGNAPPQQAVRLCCGPRVEQAVRRQGGGQSSAVQVLKGIAVPPVPPSTGPQQLRHNLARCWPHVPVVGQCDHLLLLGPPGAGLRHWDWIRQLAQQLAYGNKRGVCLGVLAGADESAPQLVQVPSGVPVVTLWPFHDWADLFLAADLCVWLPDGAEVPYFVLQAVACGRPVLAPDVPETEFLLGENRLGLRLPWQPIQSWGEQIALLLDHPERYKELTLAARNRVQNQFTYQAMLQSIFQALGTSLPEAGKPLAG